MYIFSESTIYCMEPQDDIYFSVKKRTQTSNDRKPRIFTKIAKPKKLAGKSYKFSELTDRKFNTKKRGKKLKEFKIQKNLQKLEQKREARKAARKAPNPLPAIGAEKDLIAELKDRAELGLKTHEERAKILEKRKTDKEIALELAKKQLDKLNNSHVALAPIKLLEADPFFKARTGAEKAEIKKFLRVNYTQGEKNEIVEEFVAAPGPIRNTILEQFLAMRTLPKVKSAVIEEYIDEATENYKATKAQPPPIALSQKQQKLQSQILRMTPVQSHAYQYLQTHTQAEIEKRINDLKWEIGVKNGNNEDITNEAAELAILKGAITPKKSKTPKSKKQSSPIPPPISSPIPLTNLFSPIGSHHASGHASGSSSPKMPSASELEARSFEDKYNNESDKTQFLDNSPYLAMYGITKNGNYYQDTSGNAQNTDNIKDLIAYNIRNNAPIIGNPPKILGPQKHPKYDELELALNGKNIDDLTNPSSLNKIFKDLGIPNTEWKGKDVATKQAKLKEIQNQNGKGFNFAMKGKGLNFNKEKLLGGALGHQMVSMKANEIINKLRGINKRHPYINKYTKLIKDSEDRFKQMIKGGGLLDNVTNFAKFFSKNWFDNILKPVATGLAAKAKAVQGGGIFDSFLAGLSAPFRLASKINPIFGFGVDKVADALNVPTISDVINK